MSTLKDQHFSITTNTRTFAFQQLFDPKFLNEISHELKTVGFPFTSDILSLEKRLMEETLADKEGVYYIGDLLKIGLVKAAGENYEAYVLSSKSPIWKPGERILELRCLEPNSYLAIYGDFIHKRLRSQIVNFGNGILRELHLVENTGNTDYSILERQPEMKFGAIRASEQTAYIKLKSFSGKSQNIQDAELFFNDELSSIKTPNIVVDVRNNGGGGERTSNMFFDFLKKYDGNVYLLANRFTGSNAEQFIIRLRAARDITVFGESTAGVLTYGRSKHIEKVSPSKRFMFYPTNTKDNWKTYIEYERIGVSPDIVLDPNRDWIEQVLEKI